MCVWERERVKVEMCVSAVCLSTKAECVCVSVGVEGRAAVQLLRLSGCRQVALSPPSVCGKCEKV